MVDFASAVSMMDDMDAMDIMDTYAEGEGALLHNPS